MIHLRNVEASDVEIFFEHQLDPQARHMAASTSKDPHDRQAFAAKWERTLAEPSITVRTIVHHDLAVGYIASFLRDGTREVAYWIGRDQWGRGIATAALQRFLAELPERPIHARAAIDNVGSLRVLEKCGFNVAGSGRFFSAAREGEVDEVVLSLEG